MPGFFLFQQTRYNVGGFVFLTCYVYILFFLVAIYSHPKRKRLFFISILCIYIMGSLSLVISLYMYNICVNRKVSWFVIVKGKGKERCIQG